MCVTGYAACMSWPLLQKDRLNTLFEELIIERRFRRRLSRLAQQCRGGERKQQYLHASEKISHCVNRCARPRVNTYDILAPRGVHNMERKKASDFPQELLDLFDKYVHG